MGVSRLTARCGLALAAAVSALALPATAGATSPHGPHYELKIVEGATVYPEFHGVASASATASGNAELILSIVRHGLTIERAPGHGYAYSSQQPEVGDVVTLESPAGTTIASTVYDGLPSIDATVCAGSTNFSGTNSPGDIVEGFFTKETVKFDPYGRADGWNRAGGGEAQVKSLTGTTFGGSFLLALEAGESVEAVESLKTPLANEGTYTYSSANVRPVGGCPPPPPPPPPPPSPPTLAGLIAKALHASIHGFLRFGATDTVTITVPGTVVQDLYLTGGTLPASAASTHRHRAKPALLLARGLVKATKAGTVTVHLRLTKRGRSKLKGAHTIHAVMLTTLHGSAGAKLNLARSKITLRR